MKKFYISPYVICLFLIAYFSTRFNEYLVVFLIAVIHEVSHLIFAVLLGYKVLNFKIMPYGACLEINTDFINLTDEIIISSAGPLANFIMLVFCIILKHFFNIETSFYAYANMYMMILNMIPALPLDGGRIFECATKDVFNEDYKRIYRILSFITSVFVLFLGFFLLLKTGENFSLLIAGFFMINCTKFSEEKCENICKFMYKNKSCYKPKLLVLDKDLYVYESLKYIKMDSFMIIYLIDEDKKIVKVVTNIQIIKFATQGDNSTTLEDI